MAQAPQQKRAMSFLPSALLQKEMDAAFLQRIELDPERLAASVCRVRNWLNVGVRCYDQGRSVQSAEESSIGRLRRDIVKFGSQGDYDVAILFSSDPAFCSLAADVRHIAASRNLWLKIVSAYPVGHGTSDCGGVNRTDWIRLNWPFCVACSRMNGE